MAAGQGFKTFVTGEVLTAGDVNGYLMQGINVFATTTARDAAITAPAEGQFAFTKDTNSLWYYDGAAWVASGATGDIEGVTAGTGISGGGTSGTVTVSIDTAVTVDKTTAQTLTNKTLTSPVISTITNTGTLTLPTSTDTLVGRATTDTLTNKTLTSPALTTPTISTLTTNGDLLYGTGSGALSRIGIGSTSQVLTVTGGVPVWATPTGSTKTLTQIATGTLSGSSVSVTSLTANDNLIIIVYGLSTTAAAKLQFTINNTSTGTLYSIAGQAFTTAEVKPLFSAANNTIESYYTVRNVGNENGFALSLSNCKAAGFTNFAYTAGYDNGSAVGAGQNSQGMFLSAAAVSSVEIKTSSTFNGGTYYVYGG
jgi:hypothetical protein